MHTLKSLRTQNESLFGAYFVQRQIGPFFLENEHEEAVAVNGDHYRAMLNAFLFTKIEEEDTGSIWFQQDGATCHTATFDVLRTVFEDRINSRRADIAAAHNR